jgi:phosphate transport system substrate-binding protein
MSRTTSTLWLVAAASAAAVVGCGGPSSERVVIDGSSTVFPITQEVAVAFRDDHPEVQVSIGQGGTGTGMTKFTSGEIDICNASRRITPEEIAKCQAAGFEPLELAIAIDGLAVVVNAENDWCDTLTVEQLRELWRPGSPIKNWSDLTPSWPESEIKLWGPDPDSGTFEYFTEEVIGKKNQIRDEFSPNSDDNALVSGVKNDKHALGYFGYAFYAANTDVLKLVAIDNGNGQPVKPTPQTVRDNTYSPLSRPLFIYVRNDALARPSVATFVDFYLQQAAAAAEQVDYVSVSDEQAASNREALSAAMPAAQ